MNPKSWRVMAASVQGTGHIKTSKPCQDAHLWQVLSGPTLVVAVADGAGSAALAEVGATIAVRAMVGFAENRSHSDTWPNQEEAWRGLMQEGLKTVRAAVMKEADQRQSSPHSLASTLVSLISTKDWTVAAQIGDGAAVIAETLDHMRALTRPCLGEYLNETVFLTSNEALEKAQITVHHGAITHLAVLSDGLQMLALKMPMGEPHLPFFQPVLRLIEKDPGCGSAQEHLAAFLRSPKVCARTDDDLTLVAAWIG